MRGSKSIDVFPSQNIQGLGNIPEGPKVRSFREVNTGLDARRNLIWKQSIEGSWKT